MIEGELGGMKMSYNITGMSVRKNSLSLSRKAFTEFATKNKKHDGMKIEYFIGSATWNIKTGDQQISGHVDADTTLLIVDSIYWSGDFSGRTWELVEMFFKITKGKFAATVIWEGSDIANIKVDDGIITHESDKNEDVEEDEDAEEAEEDEDEGDGEDSFEGDDRLAHELGIGIPVGVPKKKNGRKVIETKKRIDLIDLSEAEKEEPKKKEKEKMAKAKANEIEESPQDNLTVEDKGDKMEFTFPTTVPATIPVAGPMGEVGKTVVEKTPPKKTQKPKFEFAIDYAAYINTKKYPDIQGPWILIQPYGFFKKHGCACDQESHADEVATEYSEDMECYYAPLDDKKEPNDVIDELQALGFKHDTAIEKFLSPNTPTREEEAEEGCLDDGVIEEENKCGCDDEECDECEDTEETKFMCPKCDKPAKDCTCGCGLVEVIEPVEGSIKQIPQIENGMICFTTDNFNFANSFIAKGAKVTSISATRCKVEIPIDIKLEEITARVPVSMESKSVSDMAMELLSKSGLQREKKVTDHMDLEQLLNMAHEKEGEDEKEGEESIVPEEDKLNKIVGLKVDEVKKGAKAAISTKTRTQFKEAVKIMAKNKVSLECHAMPPNFRLLFVDKNIEPEYVITINKKPAKAYYSKGGNDLYIDTGEGDDYVLWIPKKPYQLGVWNAEDDQKEKIRKIKKDLAVDDVWTHEE